MSPVHKLAIAFLCLFSEACAHSQKSSTGKLTVPGADDMRGVAVGVGGHAEVVAAVPAGAQMRREVSLSEIAPSPNTDIDSIHDNNKHIESIANLTEQPPKLTAAEAASRLKGDGIVHTYNAAADSSQVIKLEEETMECMMDTPVWECMEKHGSYGVRRLYTDSQADFKKLNVWRKNWMGHPDVQRKKLFEITWPGTHDSGAYAFDPAILDTPEGGKASVKGAMTQKEDVFTQLDMGVRSIQLQVAVSKHDGKLYTANGFLMMSLSSVLTDIASFLEINHQEVVLLHMKKADVWNGIEKAHIQPLSDDAADDTKIPGETVHKAVKAVMGPHLALHAKLKDLPSSEAPSNPTMQAAIASGIRVFYFWEGQQVLCIDKAECSETPGWVRGQLGSSLAFGPGMAYGARANLYSGAGGGEPQTFIEPGCIHSSTAATQSSNPIQLLLNIKKYASALKDDVKKHPCACFPTDAAVPEEHTPSLLYAADVWASPYSESEGAYRRVYKDIEEIYTRGESATLNSEAERVNYLALNWLLRKNWQPLFTKLSIISMDYVAPINIHRIVEANQNREDCGYAIYCKETGSCWAQTLLDEKANACRPEPEVLKFLKWHAEGEPYALWMWILSIVLVALCVKTLLIAGCCYGAGNRMLPSVRFPGGAGIVWWKRAKAAPKKAVSTAHDLAVLEALDDALSDMSDSDPDLAEIDEDDEVEAQKEAKRQARANKKARIAAKAAAEAQVAADAAANSWMGSAEEVEKAAKAAKEAKEAAKVALDAAVAEAASAGSQEMRGQRGRQEELDLAATASASPF